MQLIRIALAIAVFAACGAAVPANAQQKPAQPTKRPVIINDPSVYRPPPPPHDRTYVGPGPTVTPPMNGFQK